MLTGKRQLTYWHAVQCALRCWWVCKWHKHAAQPVTYLSLALTLATGTGVTAYYLHLKEKRLKSAPRPPAAERCQKALVQGCRTCL